MKKAVFHGLYDIAIEEVETPQPGPGEILVQIRACAICASDAGMWESTGNPGHEVAGPVTAVGPDVTDVSEGDHVTVYWRIGCGQCHVCRRGYELHCQDARFSLSGGYAEYVLVPAEACLPVPDGLSSAQASLLTDTIGTPLSAVRFADVKGKTLAVWGCGPLGLMAIQLSRLFGAARCIGIDPLPFRRQKALDLGAHDTLDPSACDPVEGLRELVNDAGVEATINSVEDRQVGQQAADSTVPGGRMGIITGQPKLTVADRHFYQVWYFDRQTYPEVAELGSSGKLQLDPLITHTFPLGQTADAFRTRFERKDESLKVIVVND